MTEKALEKLVERADFLTDKNNSCCIFSDNSV